MSDWNGRTKGAIVEYEGARYSATLYEGLDHAYVYLRPHPGHVKLADLTIISEVAGWSEALRDPDGKPTKQVCKGLPTYERAIADRTAQIVRAHVRSRPVDGPGSDKWMRNQLEEMRAQAR